jgi:tRNA threonylcarbamoyladenosine biosynthesis protein TsaE
MFALMSIHSSYQIDLPTLDATQNLGKTLGQTLTAGMVVLLEGDLGSGKTTLVQSIGAQLGITEAIVSPTFTLVNEYPEGSIPLYHFDLYRLSPAEVAGLHLETYWDGIENPLGIVAIEWPDRLTPWPEQYLSIHLSHTATGRQATLQAKGLIHPELWTGEAFQSSAAIADISPQF